VSKEQLFLVMAKTPPDRIGLFNLTAAVTPANVDMFLRAPPRQGLFGLCQRPVGLMQMSGGRKSAAP
jgi:hypothetical protein